MHAVITAMTSYVPERVVTNEELAQSVDTSDEWIRSHTGIAERRIAAPDEAASDLGIAAGRRALDAGGVDPESIDLVIVASSTTDYPNFPATASIIQDRLGCTNAGAFDLAAGCTGFVYGIEVARSIVQAGSMRRVLLVAAEALTKLTNWEDRNTCVLFGDGAGAAIVEAVDDEAMTADDLIPPRGPSGANAPTEGVNAPVAATVRRSWLRSQGSGDTALIRHAGGSRMPFDPSRHGAADLQIYMEGRAVYLFAVDAVVKTIKTLCDLEGISVNDLDWIVPHQANLRIIEAAAKRLKLPADLFYTNLDRFANTSAASIPIAMTEMIERGVLTRGQRILTVGFGAGLSYGGNIIEW